MNFINLKEALDILESGQPFDVVFVSWDKKRKTGGLVKQYKGIIDKKMPKETHDPLPQKVLKNPRHYEHVTRAFKVVVNDVVTGTIKKFHLPLLLYVDGKKVVL